MAASLIKNLEELEDLDVDIPESLLIAQNKSAAAFDKGMGAGAAFDNYNYRDSDEVNYNYNQFEYSNRNSLNEGKPEKQMTETSTGA